MKKQLTFSALACAAMFASTVTTASAADLKMKFVVDSDVKAAANINPDKDVEFCGKHDIPNEKLLVNPKNKGIQNVLVYVYTGRGGSDLDDKYLEPRSKTVTLANDKCRFEPHIVLAQKGDTLKVTNPDDVGHNCNLNFFKNTAVNFTIPAKQKKELELKEDEPAPIPTDCNIHPWMRAYIVVLEHQLAATSDENGELTITGLPEGELTFRVFHESGKIDEVEINGEKEEWKRSRFELDLKDGMNDLGTVVVPVGAFE